MKHRPCASKSTGLAAASSPSRSPLSSGDAVAPREPGQRAVHRAGVEVAEAEPLREAARDGALSGPRGAVDGDDHRLGHRLEQVEESGEGYRHGLRALDPHALARDEPGDRAEDRDPVVAGGVHVAAAWAGRARPGP